MPFFYLVLFGLFYCFVPAAAQEKNPRILEIKTMYAEVNKLNAGNAGKSCKNAKMTEYSGFSPDSEQLPFEQTAKRCKLSNGYEYVEGKFRGYEWGEDYFFYRRNGSVFFVFIQSNVEACSDEIRVYFDTSGRIIRLLEKTNDCIGEREPFSSKEETSEEAKRQMLQKVSDSYEKALNMLK